MRLVIYFCAVFAVMGVIGLCYNERAQFIDTSQEHVDETTNLAQVSSSQADAPEFVELLALTDTTDRYLTWAGWGNAMGFDTLPYGENRHRWIWEPDTTKPLPHGYRYTKYTEGFVEAAELQAWVPGMDYDEMKVRAYRVVEGDTLWSPWCEAVGVIIGGE